MKIEGIFFDLLRRNTLQVKENVKIVECWNQKVRTHEIKSPGVQFRHIGWCNLVRVMQFRQSIFHILYLCMVCDLGLLL